MTIAASALAACAGSPTLRGHDTVSVQIFSGSDFYLDLEKDNYVARDKTPGELAADTTSKLTRECGALVSGENPGFGAILAPFCVLSGVTIGATAGAISKSVAAEPKKAESTLQLAIESANNNDAADKWRAMLQTSLEETGRQYGKNVVPFPGGESLYVVVQDLHWVPAAGGHWAIAGKFRAATRSGQRFAGKNFTIFREGYGIEDWLADDGRLVIDEMQLLFEQAASKVWTIVTR